MSVASPCVNVCRMNAGTGWCEGCLRTIDEIAAWGQLDDEARRGVLARLAQRRSSLAALPADTAADARVRQEPAR